MAVFEYGVSLLQPVLNDNAGEVFEPVGRFRAGPGVTVAAGYDFSRVGITASAEAAGLEIGPRRERDGIDMGRSSAVVLSFGVSAHWYPPGLEIGAWRPLVSAGYVRQRIGNVMLSSEQLPTFVREGSDSGDPADTGPAGIEGNGVRLGIGIERSLSRHLGILIAGSSDFVSFGTLTYDAREVPFPDPGLGTTPRLAVILRWSPVPNLDS